jgi:hypothetical protein
VFSENSLIFKQTANRTAMTQPGKYNFISRDELFNAIENDPTRNNFKTAALFLMSALTDWPMLNLQESKELVAALANEVKGKLTFDRLAEYQKNLNPASDAWKMESISALMELFDFNRTSDFDRTVELEAIISRITEYYR